MKKTPLFLFVMWFSAITAQVTNAEIEKKIKDSKYLLAEGKTVEYIKTTRKIIKESKQNKYSEGVAKGNYRLALAYYTQRESCISLQYALIAHREAYTARDYDLKARLEQIVGENYVILGMNSEAKAAFARMIAESKKITDPHKQLLKENMAYHDLSSVYQKEKKVDSVYYYSMKIYNSLKDSEDKTNLQLNTLLSDALVSINEINRGKNSKESAKLSKKLQEVLSRVGTVENNDEVYDVNAYNLLATVYFKEKRYNEARKYNDLSLKWAKKTKSIAYLNAAYDLRYKISEKLNDLPRAQKELQEYINLKDSISDIDKRNIQKSLKDVIVNKDVNIKKEIHHRNMLIVGIMLIILLFIGCLIFFNNYIKKKGKEQDAVVLEKNIRIIDLESRINKAFEEVIELAEINSPNFLSRFQEVYPEFCDKILKIYPNIHSSELEFCGFLKLNFSTKDIANNTFVSIKTVQMRKYRLRKKLDIPADKDIYIWVRELDS